MAPANCRPKYYFQLLGLLSVSAFSAASFANAQRAESPFRKTTSLSCPRTEYGSAVIGDRLYIIGGRNDCGDVGGDQQSARKTKFNEAGITIEVESAPINADSTIGAWTQDRPLPQHRGYISNTTVVLGNTLYVVGGTDGMEDIGKIGVKYKTALFSTLGADGRLGPWRESSTFPGPGRSCFSVAATPGYLHLIGGNTEKLEATNSVVTGVVGPTGSISTWEEGPPIPVPLWFHNAAAVSGRVYVWGGLIGKSNREISNAIYSASILGTGRLGGWRTETTFLPIGIYRGAGAPAGSYLLTFSPSYMGGTVSNDVLYSMVTPEGLSPFKRLRNVVPSFFGSGAAPDYRRGTIYLPGGGLEDRLARTPEVAYFNLTGQAREAAQSTVAQASRAQTEDITAVAAPAAAARGVVGTGSSTPGGSSVEGFTSYEAARRDMVAHGNKPLLVLFYMPGSRPSENQLKQLRESSAFGDLQKSAVLSLVDVRKEPQLSQQFGVIRAPTWLLFDQTGNLLGKAPQMLTAEQLSSRIKLVK